MARSTPQTPALWLSAQQLVKHVKGNLLGDKKKEVEELTAASPLLADALEGVKMMEHPEQLERTVASINRQIQLRSGAGTATVHALPAERTDNKGPIAIRPYLWAAASVALVAMAGFTVWQLIPRPETKHGQAVVYEEQASPQPSTNTYADSHMPPDTSSESAINSDTIIPNETNLLAYEAPVAPRTPTRVTAPITRETTDTRLETGTANHASAATIIEKELEEDSGKYGTPNSVDEALTQPTVKNTVLEHEDLADGADPDYSQAKSLLANGMEDEAAKALRKIAGNKRSGHRDDAAWDLAQLYLKKGDTGEAKKWLKKLTDSNIYGEQAKELLGNNQ
ncbi:MAG: tetratricopeptide repeat protein [Bacteroidetes bacterium]|jgi:hypothetical protein|nr:tetratricopeptide repeat protein [Bacteroidota bacterium]